jgi:uncharacterized protein
MSRLERFRDHKNSFFKEHEHSPLTEEQKERFRQLEYFPEDESLRFEVELDKQETSDEPITLGTTTGEAKEFVPAGKAHIEVEGHEVSLTVYREPGRGRYFLPFRDATAGHETYDVGRYLDPRPKPDGSLILDFNMAYNPYCAYNDNFSCPIPPAENVVSVPIRAGERRYQDKA